MLGVPNKMVSPKWSDTEKSAIDDIRICTTLHPVYNSPQRPEGIEERDAPCWYGYISTDSIVNDIVGNEWCTNLRFLSILKTVN